MEYQYQVVPFIGKINAKQAASDVASQLQAVINRYSSEGWDFFQLSDVNIEVQPGCLAAFLGGKVSYVRFDQIIFRKPS